MLAGERREAMEAGKFRNLGDDELQLEARKTSEALFRLRFQMKLGQTEGVKKLRELRKDIARIKTIERERELGLHLTPVSKSAAASEEEEGATHKHAAKAPRKKAAKPARKKAAKKSASGRKTGGRSATRRAAKPSANKKKAARSSSVKKG
jgi:large subunit ribosomal protein L29